MKIPQLTKREKLLLLLSVVLWSCIGVAAIKMIRADGSQIDVSTSIDHFTIIGSLAGMLVGIIWFFMRKKFIDQ